MNLILSETTKTGFVASRPFSFLILLTTMQTTKAHVIRIHTVFQSDGKLMLATEMLQVTG